MDRADRLGAGRAVVGALMPLGSGVRYRVKNGVRLAFKGNKVVEAKKMPKKRKRATLLRGE